MGKVCERCDRPAKHGNLCAACLADDMSSEHFADKMPKWLHHFLCHVLWFDHPVRIVHQPTRKYECKVCGYVYRDQFLEF